MPEIEGDFHNYVSGLTSNWTDAMIMMISVLELESKHDFVIKMKDLVRSLRRSVVIVMRYLFDFLNQWVKNTFQIWIYFFAGK